MTLELLEAGAHWAGGLGALIVLAVIFQGFGRGLRRPAGTTAGRFAGWLRSPLFYFLASALFFGASAWPWRPVPVTLRAAGRAAALLVGSVLYWLGLGLVVWGRAALGPMYFVSTALGAQLFAGHQLVTRGPYQVVRHPMYAGLAAAVLGGLLLYRTWTLVLLLVLPFSLGLRARREEQVLRAYFGAAWEAYCRRVPAFIPRWRRRPE